MVAQWAKQMLAEYPLGDLIAEAEALDAVGRKLRVLAPLETQVARSAAVVWSRQGDVVKAVLYKRYGIAEVYGGRDIAPVREAFLDDVDRVLDDAFATTSPELVADLERYGGHAIASAIEHRLADFAIGGAFDLANTKAVAWLHDHAADAVSGIDAETRRVIHSIVRDGADAGDSYAKIARRIVDKFETFGSGTPQRHLHTRAQLVAVTETGMAYEQGSRALVDEVAAVGIPMEKKWLTIGDERVSPGCEGNEFEGWIPIERPHTSGHQNPLRFPGCRCTELYRLKPAGGFTLNPGDY